jgi:hypothetical protein
VTFAEVPKKESYKDKIDSSGELHIRFTYNYSKSTPGRRLYFEKNGESKQLEISFLDVLKKDIDYVYIPASRSTKDIEWNETSIFSRLIKNRLSES